MATFNIPRAGEIRQNVITIFENNFNQNIPTSLKAFVHVLSVVIEVVSLGFYKFAALSAKQNYVLTATGENLDRIGRNFDVIRKQATVAKLVIELPAESGTVITAQTDFTGVLNNVLYRSVSEVTADGSDIATITVQATESGTVGNIDIGGTLEIQTNIAGLLDTSAEVTSITTTASDVESDADYRIRIFDVKRTASGGGTSSDYRNWSQEVAGVARAYPYSGAPTVVDSLPIERTVYVEATTAISEDGIAPADLLQDVRDSITTDPVTGLARQDLGLTDETLYVESITRLTIFTEIRGLTINGTADINAVKDQLNDILTQFYAGKRPYIDGLDSIIDKNDEINVGNIYGAIAPILIKNAATITGLDFRFTVSGSFQNAYILGRGELAKNEDVSYV